MRKTASLLVAFVLSIVIVVPAAAIGAAIEPSSQSRSYGQTTTWGTAWGDSGPYDVTFRYGDGTSWIRTNTYLDSAGFSRAFYPCPWATTYYQNLYVKERPTGATINATANTYVTSVTGICPDGAES